MTGERWPTDAAAGGPRQGTLSRSAAAALLARPATPLGATLLWNRAVLPGWSDALSRLGAPDTMTIGTFVNGYLYLDDNALSLATAIGDASYQQHVGWVLRTEDWPELAVSTAMTSRRRATRPKLAESLDVELHQRVDSLIGQLRAAVSEHTVANEALKTAITALDATRVGLRETVGAPGGALDILEPAGRVWDLSRTVRASTMLTAIFDDSSRLEDRLEARRNEPDVRAFVQAVAWLIERHGALGARSWDLDAPTWEQRPELALRAIAWLRLHDDSLDPRQRQTERRAARAAALDDALATLGRGGEVHARADAARLALSRFVGWRSQTRLNCMTLVAELRMVFDELGQRWSAAGHLREAADVLMLEDHELGDVLADPGAYTLVAADRHELWRALATHEPPARIEAGEALPAADAVPQRLAARSRGRRARTIVGIPASSGSATGPSRVLRDVSDATSLMPGEVVVIADGDPAWVPVLVGAAAVIVESGSWAGHAVVACRELGVPCVVGADHITRTVRDGTMLELDGDTGTVRIV